MSPKRTTQDGRLSQPSEVPAMPCWRTQSRRQRLSVRLFQKRATASMSTVQRLLLRPRTPRTRGTNVKQTSKTRPSSPTTQPDSTRSAVDRTVNRWPLQREAAANDARTAPTPPVTTRWNTAGHPQGTLHRQTDRRARLQEVAQQSGDEDSASEERWSNCTWASRVFKFNNNNNT